MEENKRFTTISVSLETHKKLTDMRSVDGETYNSIIKRLICEFVKER